MKTDLTNTYLQMQEKNYPLCFVQGKRPYKANWQHNPEKSSLPLNNGFGLLTGEPSGIVALDMDSLDDAVKEKLKALIKTEYLVSGRIGNPKKLPAIFFKMSERTKKKVTLGGIDVEILSTGQQIVLPPSIHPDTNKPYIWVGKPLYSEIELPIFPDELLDALEKLNAEHGGKNKSNEITKGTNRCNHGSHNTLSSLGVALLHEGQSVGSIIEKLLEEDERINGEISYFKCPSRKWQKETKEANALSFMSEMIERNLTTGDVESVHFENSILKDFTAIEQPKLKEVVEKEGKKSRAKFPKLRGYGAELFDHCYNHSVVPRSRFSSMAVLTLISTLMGNKYSYEGIQANLFSVLVSDQGGGKDYPLKFPKKVLTEIGLSELVGMANPASDVSLIMNLIDQRTRIDTVDEVTRLFRGMTQNAASHMSAMGDMVNELYSAPSSIFGGKNAQKYQNSKNNVQGNIGGCFSPFVSLISATTFSGFEKSFTDELFQSGLGSRFIFMFEDEGKRPKSKNPNFKMSDDLKEFLKSMRGPEKVHNVEPMAKFPIYEMQATEKAKEAFEDFTDYCYDVVQERGLSAKTKAMYSRMALHARKLAMIDAVLYSGNVNPKITVENVEWAKAWLIAYVKSATLHIDSLIVANSYEADLNKVEAAVRKAGCTGITRSELSRACRIPNYKNYVLRLQEGDQIFLYKMPNDAPQTKRYIHKSFFGKKK